MPYMVNRTDSTKLYGREYLDSEENGHRRWLHDLKTRHFSAYDWSGDWIRTHEGLLVHLTARLLRFYCVERRSNCKLRMGRIWNNENGVCFNSLKLSGNYTYHHVQH